MTGISRRLAESGLHDLFGILTRRLPVILLCLVVVTGAAVGFSMTQEKKYSTSTDLLFRDPDYTQQVFGPGYFAAPADPTREAATNQQLLSLDVIAGRTSRKLGNGLTAGELRDKITVEPRGQSDVIRVTVEDTSPSRAALIANQFAREYIRFRQQADRRNITRASLQVRRQYDRLSPAAKQAGEGEDLRSRQRQLAVLADLQTGNAEIVQPAAVPQEPSSPKPLRNGILGVFLGFVLGTALAFLLDRVDRRLKGMSEAEDAFGQSVLAAIPESGGLESFSTEANLQLAPGEREAFQMLRANLRYYNVDKEIRSILVTSAGAGEGKTTVAWNLAFAAGRAGEAVSVIEADLRHPMIAKRLGIPETEGLGAVLSGQLDADSVIRSLALPDDSRVNGSSAASVDVLTAGPPPPNPIRLLSSERLLDTIEKLRDRSDLVIVDGPPASVVADAIPLLTRVDGVIVVCRLRKTTRDAMERLRQELEKLGAPVLGLVVNCVETGTSWYGYGYGDYYRRDPESERGATPFAR